MEARECGIATAGFRLLIVAFALTGTGCASAPPTSTPPRPRHLLGLDLGSTLSRRATTHQELSLNASAHVASEPAQIHVRTRLEPDARNRSLTIEWWSTDGVGGSHSIALEGDQAPIRHDCVIKALRSGKYELTAVLVRADGTQVRRSTRVIVLGEGTTFDADTYEHLAER